MGFMNIKVIRDGVAVCIESRKERNATLGLMEQLMALLQPLDSHLVVLKRFGQIRLAIFQFVHNRLDIAQGRFEVDGFFICG